MSTYTLDQLKRIAQLIQCDTSIVLTSSNWGQLALDVGLFSAVTPTPGNFRTLDIKMQHTLRVVNSGTEDEKQCDKVNRIFEAASKFVEARDKFGVRKGTKKDAIEYVDAESQDEIDPEIIKEKIRREELRREKL